MRCKISETAQATLQKLQQMPPASRYADRPGVCLFTHPVKGASHGFRLTTLGAVMFETWTGYSGVPKRAAHALPPSLESAARRLIEGTHHG